MCLILNLPLSVSLAKKYSFFDSSPSLLSHLQYVSKSCCFFYQNIFKNWPLFPSTLVQVTFISPGCLPPNCFPCFLPCYLAVYVQDSCQVKNLCHFSTQSSTLTLQLPHCKNQRPHNFISYGSVPRLLYFSHAGLTVVPQTCQICSLLRISHWLNPLPRKFFPQVSTWLKPSSLSSLCSTVTFSVRPSWVPSPPRPSQLLILLYI